MATGVLLNLTSAIFNPLRFKRQIADAVKRRTLETEREIKRRIRDSKPSGRNYKRGNKIIGFKFHRASAPGQPPAIDKGILINSISSKFTNFGLSGTVEAKAKYAAIVNATRPFMTASAENNFKQLRADVLKIVLG